MDMKKIIDMFVVDGEQARAEFSRQLSNQVGKTVFGDDFVPEDEPATIQKLETSPEAPEQESSEQK